MRVSASRRPTATLGAPVSCNARYTSDGTSVARKHACCVAKDCIASAKLRWSRLPAALKPITEQLVCIGLMRPDGDRRNGAQSGRVETQVEQAIRQHDVVRVFVLSHDFGYLYPRMLF